ncbi:flagellar motor switch protein FliN [Entomospira entomophila]|uniref:flagellar motor switch protein FliN n=1 Tax=Entomospira entomophila TaxID=2719988 RepID=UPI001FE4D611|nr:flagellar motor switch protein FliN [Entomospira entomophilus]WDI36053.1 flagellar motor switch protein FliN [Entomospira entomophilus]
MMGDGSLSQDEINALLMGATGHKDDNDSSFPSDTVESISQILAPLTQNIQQILQSMTDRDISVSMQTVTVSDKVALIEQLNEKIIDALTSFSGDLLCNQHYLLNATEATKLTEELTGQVEPVESDVIPTTAIAEFLSSLAEKMAVIISEQTGGHITSSPVNAQFVDAGMTRLPSDDFILVPYNIQIGEETITLYIVIESNLITALSPQSEHIEESGDLLTSNENNASYYSQNQANVIGRSTNLNQPTPVVQGVSLPNLVNGSAPQETKNIGLLMDVMMEVTVELGRTRQPIKDILSIGEGTILELDKLAGEPVDILVNHNRIAKGEVVVIDENFGVRITEILSGADKLSDR